MAIVHEPSYCSPSAKPSGLQACTHPPEGKRKERAIREKEREGSTKGKGGLYNNLQILSPSKVAKEWRNIPLGVKHSTPSISEAKPGHLDTHYTRQIH